ncbi:cell wall / vacuolar inhibitor of fructosidase 2 [Diospyros lotus]|uniref:cell wall / vacuolar inhibitor of fructosidase 2 n=1 Tax=Diospyros lotus TaxID=55363 RepID=UPI00224E874E|nr:cell wall / vacuolar inhibitor of fructosidase 2 [Diospyros lotus]
MASSTCSSSSFSLLLSIALFISFFRPPVLVNGDADLIQRTCKSTKHYDLCVSSLKSDPTSPKADTKGLAAIMVGVGIANATATSSYLSSQVTSINASDMQVLKKVFKECADKYSNSGNSLQSAFQDIAAESYDYAYMHVMAAADYPNACHSAFKRYGALSYPPDLAAREDGLKRICDVVLGIIDLMLADK